MMWTDERLARAALTAAVEPGSVTTANRLCEMTAEGLWRQLLTDSGERWHERAKSLDVGRLVERSEQAAMRFLIPGDQEWPTSLDSLARVAKSGMGEYRWGCGLLGLLTSPICHSSQWLLWDAALPVVMVRTLP